MALGGKDRWISEFKASLVYRVNSRTVRAIQRDLLKNQTKPNKQKAYGSMPFLSEFFSFRQGSHIITQI